MSKPVETLGLERWVADPLAGFSVTVMNGPDKGTCVRASAAELSIGTDPTSDLTLTDPHVSRHHCTITSTRKGCVLRDHASRNGSWVGGVRIETGYLFEGVSFEVGKTMLCFASDQPIESTVSVEPKFGRLLGASEPMRRIFALLPRLATSDTTLLIDGETGTGKGALALAIHEQSVRKRGPFVVLDCAAIPPTLVESELFGHVAGAFTGAVKDRAGLFELAKGGTIFIDEIGELPAEIQPKLLRALEERTVKPVGGGKPVPLDVRVIAATNRDLKALVNEGSFRSDLYYRLHVVRIHVPPLRERKDDILLLAKHFYAELLPGQTPSQSVLASFMRQPWPGNVRELRGAVERTILLEGLVDSEPGAATPPSEKQAQTFDPTATFRDSKAAATAEWERKYVTDLLRHCEGNLSKASRIVQMDRSYLRALVKRHGVNVSEIEDG